MKKILILVVVLAAIAGGTYLYISNWYNTGIENRVSTSTETVIFEVKSGESISSIADNLKAKGLIDSQSIFTFYVKRENKASTIQAGFFKIPKNSTVPEIVDILGKAVSLNVTKVTVIEGYRNSQIATALEKAFSGKEGAVFSKSEFNTIISKPDSQDFEAEVADFLKQYKPAGKSLEGFLYPDTYEFENSATTQTIVETMIKHFISKTKDVQKGSDFYSKLILASIVERESLTNEEKDEIASVFTNRLKIGMALQSDATVNYATGKSDPQPTLEDTKVNSPYNTYKYTGLPPTPICNPRLESIQAAVTPAKTDYYYFIHEQDGSGKVHFAKTSAEHYENVRKYLN